MIIWHRAQLVVVDKSHIQRTQRSCLKSCPLRVTRGIGRIFSLPFSEPFQISKNEDFNGPYLENEFFKNSFETVFRASKSRGGQLVSAFQLTRTYFMDTLYMPSPETE